MTHNALTTVERFVPATPARIFELLSEPARHSQIDGSGAVRRVKSGPSRVAMGDKFVMAMRMGIPYSTASSVVEFELNRRIAWQTFSTVAWIARFGGGRIWRYELEPVDGGTLVRETWDLTHEAPRSSKGLAKPRVRDHMIANMNKTLVRLEEAMATDAAAADGAPKSAPQA
jgi:uncharacterized protein YndB with AHSA1/START domain